MLPVHPNCAFSYIKDFSALLWCGVWDNKRSTDQEGSSHEKFTEPGVREYNDSRKPMVLKS